MTIRTLFGSSKFALCTHRSMTAISYIAMKGKHVVKQVSIWHAPLLNSRIDSEHNRKVVVSMIKELSDGGGYSPEQIRGSYIMCSD